jgi:hypothetical protein
MTTKKNHVVVVIAADGVITKAVQKSAPRLEELQRYVGGPVQVVPHFTLCTFDGRLYQRGTCYAHEEGKLIGLPLNNEATAAWWKQLSPRPHRGDLLVGNVVYCAPTEETCDTSSR